MYGHISYMIIHVYEYLYMFIYSYTYYVCLYKFIHIYA